MVTNVMRQYHGQSLCWRWPRQLLSLLSLRRSVPIVSFCSECASSDGTGSPDTFWGRARQRGTAPRQEQTEAQELLGAGTSRTVFSDRSSVINKIPHGHINDAEGKRWMEILGQSCNSPYSKRGHQGKKSESADTWTFMFLSWAIGNTFLRSAKQWELSSLSGKDHTSIHFLNPHETNGTVSRN